MGFCAIGDPDSILGYELAGAAGFSAHDEESARAAFRKAVADTRFQVLTITENAAAWIEPEIDAHRLSGQPPFVAVVPGLHPASVKRKSLADMVQQAVGVSTSRD